MNAIVVTDRNWAIGKDNCLLFSLPTDMKHFRAMTLNGTVLMGRKTLESFPGGNPLPRRRNIVITREKCFSREGVEVVHCCKEAMAAVEGTDPDTVWVIGGGSVYTCTLSQCKRVILTRVDTVAEDADTFFPNLDRLPNWKQVSASEPIEENGLTFRFLEYENTAL